MFHKFFQRRELSKAFGKHLSSEDIDRLLSNKPLDRELKERNIQFICLSVRGETAQIISERLALASKIAVDHAGMIISEMSEVLVIVYGAFPNQTDSTKQVSNLCQALNTQLSRNIRILHGSRKTHWGVLGSEKLSWFGFVSPDFLRVLVALDTLPYGENQEFREK